MILTGVIVIAIVAAYVVAAIWLSARHSLSFHQAALYLPLKVLYRIDDRDIREARQAPAPVIYVVTHQSRLDPALMLSLLPATTLHILDGASAKSMRLEPWKVLGRTITFNAAHLFVSRRLVRHLRGRGRLAVYLPEMTEPAPKVLSLYRAVARVAARAEARVVAIYVSGYDKSQLSTHRADAARFGSFPRLKIHALPAATLNELSEAAAVPSTAASNLLLERLNQSRGTPLIKRAA